MADAEELESFARLNVASQRVTFYSNSKDRTISFTKEVENIPIKVFEMARDDEFGRMVIASKDLAVGDVVMEVRFGERRSVHMSYYGVCCFIMSYHEGYSYRGDIRRANHIKSQCLKENVAPL